MRVCIVDDNYRGLNKRDKALSLVWYSSAATIGRFDLVIRAKTWNDAMVRVAKFIDSKRPKWLSIQVWGHGWPADPRIGDTSLDVEDFRSAVADVPGDIWFRSCDTFKGQVGHRFAMEFTRRTGYTAYGHTMVISWGPTGFVDVVFQSGGHGLRPGETPDWPASEGGLSGRRRPNTCSILTRSPPIEWLQLFSS